MTPTIYLDSFKAAYESGESFESVVDKIVDVYLEDERKTWGIDIDFFRDYEKVKDRICYRLVGRNGNDEFLANVPHIDFLDLAICFYYDYRKDGAGEGIINIYNSHMEIWGVSPDELFKRAHANTPCLRPWEYSTIEDVLQEMTQAGDELPFEPEEGRRGKVPLKILSNVMRVQGSACILYPGVLEEIAVREGGSFYIIPSSVHELIILPDNGAWSSEAVKKIIAEVNSTQVAPEEVLSGNLYYYDSANKEIIIA